MGLPSDDIVLSGFCFGTRPSGLSATREDSNISATPDLVGSTRRTAIGGVLPGLAQELILIAMDEPVVMVMGLNPDW